MHSEYIDYGKLIKKLRKKLNMTQTELAEKIECRKSSISNYENGYSTPSALILEKIAEAFDMNFADFISYDRDLSSPGFNMPRVAQPVNDTVIPYIKSSNVNEEVLSSDHYMDSYITVPSFMLNEKDGYMCIKMPDDSMENEHIQKNDYIIVKKAPFAENKQLVLAIYKPENTYVIRRYVRDENIIALVPSSMSMKYNIIRADKNSGDVVILGSVERVISAVK